MSITAEQLSAQLGLDCFGKIQMNTDSVANFSRATQSQLTFLMADKKHGELNLQVDCAVITTSELAEKIKAQAVVITTCTFVNKSIFKPGAYCASLSAQEHSTWLKNHARLHRLDTLSRQFSEIERQFKRFTDKGEGSDK